MSYATPEALLAALDAAHDDAARTALLKAASLSLREQLAALLTYRKLNADVEADLAAEEAAMTAFSHRLDAAEDDGVRLALIRAADPAFVAEWRWRLTATAEDWQRRYFAMLGNDTDGEDWPPMPAARRSMRTVAMNPAMYRRRSIRVVENEMPAISRTGIPAQLAGRRKTSPS